MTLTKDLGTLGFSQSNVNSWSDTVVEVWSLQKEPRTGVENSFSSDVAQKSLEIGQRNRKHPLWQVPESVLFNK